MPPVWPNRLCEYSFDITGDENDIPNWFNHQRDGNLISFTIGPEFPTIALCTAFGIQDSYNLWLVYHVVISINGSKRTFERRLIENGRSFGQLSFRWGPQSSLQELFGDLQLTNRNHVEILCEIASPFGAIAGPIFKRIAVHVEFNCPPQNPRIFQDINRHQPPVNDDFDFNKFPLWGRMGRLLIQLFVMVFFYIFILFLIFK